MYYCVCTLCLYYKILLKECKLLILSKINMSYMKLCVSQALWLQ